MLDHVLDDLHMLFLLCLEIFIYTPLPDFLIRIRGGIFQQGLIVLNRVFLTHQGFVQYLESGLYGDFVFFPLAHLDFLINIFKIMIPSWFLQLYNKIL